MSESKQIQCPDCQGEGQVPLGEHFVSYDMAVDAGDPSLEGQSAGVEWGKCSTCEGDGWILDPPPYKPGHDGPFPF